MAEDMWCVWVSPLQTEGMDSQDFWDKMLSTSQMDDSAGGMDRSQGWLANATTQPKMSYTAEPDNSVE